MAIQNLITGDLKIRNINGILYAVDGIVFADSSGTMGTSGTSGTSGSSTILYGTSGSVIVIPSTTTTTAAPSTTTTTTIPTTTTTTAAPTTTTTTVAFISFYLQFSSLSQSNACSVYPSDLNEYFIAFGASLQNGTILYSDSALTTPVINGYYSDGSKSWLTASGNGVLANETYCTTTTTTTAAPTTTTTTAAPTTTTTTFAAIPMILTFNVANNGDSITLPYDSAGTYSGTINWGDGNITANSYANRTHTYATAGNYDVTINGLCQYFGFILITTSANRLKDIKQWGDVYMYFDSYMFYNCTNLTGISATDAPVFRFGPNLEGMFSGCTLLGTTTTNMNSWDMSTVTSMRFMFYNCVNFNSNISSWNIGNVSNLESSFRDATSFNQNIGSWNVSSVTTMSSMFNSATSFNQNIGSWNVSNVTDMDDMFSSASSFNQNLSGWCVTNIPTTPINFAAGATAWALPKPIWGTCP